MTTLLPEFAAFPVRGVFDGELVAFDEGECDFDLLCERMLLHVERQEAVSCPEGLADILKRKYAPDAPAAARGDLPDEPDIVVDDATGEPATFDARRAALKAFHGNGRRDFSEWVQQKFVAPVDAEPDQEREPVDVLQQARQELWPASVRRAERMRELRRHDEEKAKLAEEPGPVDYDHVPRIVAGMSKERRRAFEEALLDADLAEQAESDDVTDRLEALEEEVNELSTVENDDGDPYDFEEDPGQLVDEPYAAVLGSLESDDGDSDEPAAD